MLSPTKRTKFQLPVQFYTYPLSWYVFAYFTKLEWKKHAVEDEGSRS